MIAGQCCIIRQLGLGRHGVGMTGGRPAVGRQMNDIRGGDMRETTRVFRLVKREMV